MKKVRYGLNSILINDVSEQDKENAAEALMDLELSDQDIVVMRYPTAIGIAGIHRDDTWLKVDALKKVLNCEGMW